MTPPDFASGTAPVGSYTPHRLGLYDLGGNVWEWCGTWYRKEMNTYEARKHLSFVDDDGGGHKSRVLRGASWKERVPVFLGSSFREFDRPADRLDFIGFRCVLVVAGR